MLPHTNQWTTYYLILPLFCCNKLHGKIKEIGNGSSHKRIQITKYIIEVTTTCTFDLGKTHEQVGGIQKPHGNAHNPGLLSPFNIEVIKRLFEEAGITLFLIQQLELEKEQSKLANVTSFFSGPDKSAEQTEFKSCSRHL